jgi:hypothetical protein
MLAGTQCTQIVTEAAQNGMKATTKYLFMPQTCAGDLEGGLTRANFQLALRTMDMTSPMLRPGLRMHMNGLADAYLVEGGLFQKWDAAKQTYVNQGDIIDLDGKASLCAWDPASS